MSFPATHAVSEGMRAHPLIWLIVATVLASALLLAALAVFGNVTPAPSFDLAPDPAGVELPF